MNFLKNFRKIAGSRNPLLLFTASAISYFGDWIYFTAVSALLYRVDGITGVSTYMTLRYLPGILLPPVGGMLSDRFSKRTLMVTSDLARAAIMVGLALLSTYGSGSSLMVISLSIAAASFGAIFRPARMALLPSLVQEEEERNILNSLDGTVSTLALCLAPALGAISLTMISAEWLFALNGVSFLVSGVLILALKFEAAPKKVEAIAPPVQPAASSPLENAFNVDVIRLILLYTFSHIAVGGCWVFLVELANTRFSNGDSAIGLLTSVIGVGSVLGMILGGSVPSAWRMRAIPIAIIFFGLMTASVAASTYAAAAAASVFLMGLFANIAEAPFWTSLQKAAPKSCYGRVCGWVDSISVGGLLVGSWMVGRLIALGSLESTVVALGAFVVLGTALTVLVTSALKGPAYALARSGS